MLVPKLKKMITVKKMCCLNKFLCPYKKIYMENSEKNVHLDTGTQKVRLSKTLPSNNVWFQEILIMQTGRDLEIPGGGGSQG